ncbi:MAG: signal transduction histidine kinase/CheY-like chemotaxis protein [Enterobacterales bacterium]|jgi:signal transduction histidine kinase/CheY-like chemotaxis protein
MSIHNKISTNNFPKWPLFPAFIVACLLNYFYVDFFTGSELIFGNVIAVIVLFIYGLWPAVIISVVAGMVTYFHWGMIFNVPPFLFEILALHWAIKNQKNPVYIGMLYWAFVGWLIVGLEVHYFIDLELFTKYAITIKYVINGFLNVLLGYVIAQYIISNTRYVNLQSKQNISSLLINQLFYMVTIIVITISIFWLKAFQNEKLNDYQQQIQIKANHVSSEVENYIINHQKALILSALNNQNISDPIKIQQLLQRLKNTYPTILTLLSTDNNGEITATSPKSLLKTISFNGAFNVADRSYFYQVKKNGKPFISDVFKGRGFGADPIVAVSVALKHDEGFIGIIEASLNLELLKKLDKKEIAPEEGLIILDNNNRVIYASEHLNYEFLKDLSGLNLIKHLSVPNDYYIEDEIGNNLIVKSADSEVLGWKVISTLPRSVYDASINRYLLITLTVLGLFIILSFYVARWIVLIVTKPIDALSKALSKADNSADLVGLKLTVGNQKLIEISNVEQKLNEFAIRSKQLMSDLKQANANQDIANEKLQNLNENLEQIVAAKTKELSIALVKANDASDAKSEFLATMSHEIRTPMNGVLGMLEILEDTPLKQQQSEYIRHAKTSAVSLLTLINDILDFSKVEVGKLDLEIIRFDIIELLEGLVSSQNLVVKDKQLTINLNHSECRYQYLNGDPGRIRQVLSNLISNAIKFTLEGTININVRLVEQNKLARLEAEVIDTGIGIAEEYQSRLFDSFTQADNSTTRKFGGTGLGLAISKKLCELMGGSVSVTSKIGEGSTFKFQIHIEIDENQRQLDPKIKDDIKLSSPSNHSILLVEDNIVNQKVASMMLHKQGFKVITADNGLLALEHLKETSNKYAAILMDCQMPVMDGYTATQHIRNGDVGSSNKDIPIIALTANAMKGDKEKCLEAGMNDYLTKPINSEKLFSILQQHA